MADETKNYGFPKPGEDDFYDIGIFNLAMDRADEAIKEAEEKTGRHCMDKGIHITEEEREKWDSSLLSTGDSKDNTVTFNSGDAINPTGWADVGLVESGEEHKSLWRKVSLFAKNMRYLWKLYGAHDISKLGDGTLTGAISKLNTDFLKANEVKSYFAPEPPTNDIFASFSHWVFHVTKVGRVVTITTNFAARMNPTINNDAELLVLPKEYRPYDWYEIFTHVTQGGKMTLVAIDGATGRVGIHNLGKGIDDWLCRWCITYIARE